MQDLLSMIASLNRPRLLIQAARFGVDNYLRDSALPRLLGGAASLRSGPAVLRLLELEASLNDERRARGAAYSYARHVDVLIALLGEARQLRAAAGRP
jgi:hypothetical protein